MLLSKKNLNTTLCVHSLHSTLAHASKRAKMLEQAGILKLQLLKNLTLNSYFPILNQYDFVHQWRTSIFPLFSSWRVRCWHLIETLTSKFIKRYKNIFFTYTREKLNKHIGIERVLLSTKSIGVMVTIKRKFYCCCVESQWPVAAVNNSKNNNFINGSLLFVNGV